jgi:peptidoglycan/LPS O-acetylase OafA/YrhL
MFQKIYKRFQRITTNQLYFPEIDGIRFIAILLVVLFHTHGYFAAKTDLKFTDDPNQYHLLNTFLLNGDRGVELFFVLSGFILCLPFAHHYINHGKKVVLKKYYLRRVTRLEPPYFIAMTAIFLMQLGMKVHPANELIPHWGASMIYAHDFIYHHAPLLTVVAWSLEIEIQFYLLAPLLFALLALHRNTRRLILLSTIFTIIILQELYPPPFLSIYGFAQYFLTGILLADVYVSDAASAWFKKSWVPFAAFACLAVIVYLPIKDIATGTSVVFVSKLLLPVLIGLFYYAVLKNDTLKRIFSYKFVPIIGGMCYTIYLLHYTLISIFGRFTLRLHVSALYIPNLILQTLLLCLPVLLISSVYYLYIERPFMSKKWMDMLLKKDRKAEEANMQANES